MGASLLAVAKYIYFEITVKSKQNVADPPKNGGYGPKHLTKT